MNNKVKQYEAKLKQYGIKLYEEYLKMITLHHKSKNSNSIIKILKKGQLISGENLTKKERCYSGGQAMDKIFGNIRFNDIHTMKDKLFINSFIIKSNIINDQDIYFNDGWYADTVDIGVNNMLDNGKKNILQTIRITKHL